MDEWNRHCRSGRQCGSAIQGLDRIWARYLTDWVYSAITVAVAVAKWEGYGKLFRHPTAVRRGVGGFRVAKHLHLPVTLDKQAETAGRERDDAHVGERTERFWDGLIRRRVVLLATAGELDVAVDRDDATDTTQSEAVGCIRRLPLLGYGMLSAGQYEFLPCFLHVLEDAQIRLQIISGGGLDVGVSELSCDHADVGSGLDRQRAERVA